MNTPIEIALAEFVGPFIGFPVWGARQGYGSFLNLEFGEPELVVKERLAGDAVKRRSAYVQGCWHIWIYCCEWRVLMDGAQIAWSEDAREEIARATGMLDGQILTNVVADQASGKSCFEFDLGGRLETWPTGDDPIEEQWLIYGPGEVFGYRADGCWMKQPPDTPRESERWI